MSSQPTRHGNTIIFPASLDPDAVSVVRKLNEAGFESYLVGGCVRDLLCGMIPKDFDVSTAARPRQIRSRFRNCRVIGRRFKLAHVHFGSKIIEVATFRRTPQQESESEESDDNENENDIDREEDDLLITRDNVYGTAEQDVLRRDFTINALLYDVATDEVIDYVGGVEDLNKRVLRTIGEPITRLAEDPVRMLRALKFRSRIGLTFEPDFDAAMHESANLITRSAPPRVLEEIFKLVACGKAATALPALVEYGLLEHLLPDISDYWKDHVEQLAAYGAALDIVDHGQRRVSNGFLLAVLMFEPWRHEMVDGEGDPMALARDIITPAARHMSISRRDVAIMKQLLVLQPRLAKNRKSRRVRMDEFLARPITRQAIELLYVTALAGGVDPEAHAIWARRVADLAPAPAESADRAGPRKRRRGSRRRRRGGSGGGGSAGGGRSQDEAGRRSGPRSGPGSDDARGRSKAPGRGAGRPSEPAPSGARPSAPERTSAPASGARSSRPEFSSPPAEAASELAPRTAAPRRVRGLRGLIRKLLGQPEAPSEAPAPSPRTPTPEPRPSATEHPADPAAPVPDDQASDGQAGEGPPRRRRRRRGGRGRRGGQRRRQEGEASEGSSKPSGEAPATDRDKPQAEGGTERKGRRRRSRRGGASRGGGGQGGQSARNRSGSGGGRSETERKRSGSSRRGKGRGRSTDRHDPTEPKPDDKPGRTPAVHERPEDIEDLFDW